MRALRTEFFLDVNIAARLGCMEGEALSVLGGEPVSQMFPNLQPSVFHISYPNAHSLSLDDLSTSLVLPLLLCHCL